MLRRAPYEARDHAGVRLGTVTVSWRQRCRCLLVGHAREGGPYAQPAVIDVVQDLGLRPGGGQAGNVSPVRVPVERGGRGPRPEFPVEVVVQHFECVPRDAPRRRPSLDPPLRERDALSGLGDGTPVRPKNW